MLQTLFHLHSGCHCVISHFENMTMFSVTFFFSLFGFADSDSDCVSADLGKSAPYLKTTLVHIPLRMERVEPLVPSVIGGFRGEEASFSIMSLA